MAEPKNVDAYAGVCELGNVD